MNEMEFRRRGEGRGRRNPTFRPGRRRGDDPTPEPEVTLPADPVLPKDPGSVPAPGGNAATAACRSLDPPELDECSSGSLDDQ